MPFALNLNIAKTLFKYLTVDFEQKFSVYTRQIIYLH